MSISNNQLLNLAEILDSHEAVPEVRDRMKKRLFERFLSSTLEERKIISDIMDAEKLFFAELQNIIAELKELTPINDTPEDT